MKCKISWFYIVLTALLGSFGFEGQHTFAAPPPVFGPPPTPTPPPTPNPTPKPTPQPAPTPTPVSPPIVTTPLGNRDVYLAPRTDGNSGAGTPSDPFNASSASQYDALLQRFSSNTTFHYAAGLYQTNGYAPGNGNVGSSCAHVGSGIDQTIIQLIGSNSLIFGADYIVNEFQIQNLTLDCNASHNPNFLYYSGAVTAFYATGSDILIQGVKVKGFGTRGNPGHPAECFVVTSYPGDAYAGQSFHNIHVENCIFTEPASGNTDGASVVNLGCTSNVHVTDTQVSNCTFEDASDFVYIHAFYALDCEGNTVTDYSAGWYTEPGSGGGDFGSQTVVIKNNTFHNVNWPLLLLFHPNGSYGPISFTNNEIEMPNRFGIPSAAVWIYGNFGQNPSIASLTVAENSISGIGQNPATSSFYAGIDIMYPSSVAVVGSLTIVNNQFHNYVPSGWDIALNATDCPNRNVSGNTYSNGATVPITWH